jgi:hypothetical protein
MRKMVLISLILVSPAAHAAVITIGPSNCSAATINSAISSANNGDTLLLTCTGSVTWTATVRIPSTKGITLQVQGGTNTPKTSANFPLVVLSEQSPAIQASIGTGNAPTRITGFKFSPNTGTASPFIQVDGMGNGSGIGGFRVDNNYFDTISAVDNVAVWTCRSSSCPASGGELFGLIDNNTFHNIWYRANPSYGPYNIQIWNYWKPASPANQCWGCDGWTSGDFAYGGENSVFVEDNLFEQTATAPAHMRHYISAELGARYVSRHNTFINNFPDTNADLHDAHGLCLVSSNGAGARGGEIYANTIQGTGYDRAIIMRGGSWLIYDNVITAGGGNAIELNEYRANSSQGQCSSSSALVLMPPWPVPTGATWNPNAAWISAVSDGNQYQLPQQIFNTYTWNNTAPGGALINPVVPNDLVQTTYIQNNRDYFASTTKPAALSSYTPYTYPHPLQGGGQGGGPPAAPTGLTAVVQ